MESSATTSRTTRLATILTLLLAVGLVAAVVTATGRGPSSVSVAPLATDDAPPEDQVPPGSGPSEIDLEADGFGDTEVHWISAAQMQPDLGFSLNHASTTNCVYTNGANFINAPIDLPNGATITGVNVYYYDNDSASNQGTTATIRRHETIAAGTGSSPGFNDLYRFNSDGTDAAAAPGFDGSTMSFVGDPDTNVIDLTNYTYTFYAGTDSDSGQTQFCGAQIFWLPENEGGLVFHPVEPCAIYDTRLSQGGRGTPLAAQETVTFDTVLNDYSAQGGVTGSCGIPDEDGGGLFDSDRGTMAVMINVVALNAAGDGNLKVWNDDDAEPNGGALVFREGINTNAVLPMGISADFTPFLGSATEGGFINIKNNASTTTDVRVVVVGYYDRVEINQT